MKFSPGFERYPYIYGIWRGGQHNRTPHFAGKADSFAYKPSTIMENVSLRAFLGVR
jgi:hypothetical protein